jgi:hypothetical protein
MTDLRSQTFGIEIETGMLSREDTAKAIQTVVGGTIAYLGDIYDSWAVTAPDGRVWKAARDGSIQSPNGDAAEVVSPILTYQDIDTVQAVTRAIKAAGARVTAGCGIHVHVGVPGITGKELANLTKIVDKQEEYIFQALGVLPQRRDRYTRPVEESLLAGIAREKPKTAVEFKKLWYDLNSTGQAERFMPGHYDVSRYHGLNLHATFTKGTVEFRYFNGSLHPGKIKAYIQFCLALTAYGRNARAPKAGRRVFRRETSKYDFRVFLTTLGLNGNEFKVCRLHMLARLAGDSGRRPGSVTRRAA